MKNTIGFIFLISLGISSVRLFESVYPTNYSIDSTDTKLDYSLKISPHIHFVEKHSVPDDSFYSTFRDFDDFVKHSYRPAYLEVSFYKHFKKGWLIQTTQSVRPNWKQMEDEFRYPKVIKDFDYNLNYKGFIQKSGNNYLIKYGRDDLVWDPERTGTLLSNNLLPVDQFRLDIWGNRWFYHSFIIDADQKDVLNIFKKNEKNIIGHRLEFELFHNLIVTYSELVSISQRLSFAELNPFFLILHNLENNAGTHNVILSIGARKIFNNHLQIFFQFDVDEIDTKLIDIEYRSKDADLRPFTRAIQFGGSFRGNSVVYTKTSPGLYDHFSKSEKNEPTFVYTESRFMEKPEYFNRFIGYPLGGGVESLEIIIGKIGELSFQYRWVNSQKNVFFESFDTPPFLIETRNRLAFEWTPQITSVLELILNLSWEYSKNYHHTKTNKNVRELLLGISYNIKAQKNQIP